MRHKLLLAAVLLTLVAFAPLFSVLLAWGLTSLFHCQVGHGQAKACLVGGVDLTPTLMGMGLFGWWMAVSWILLIPAGLLWAIWIVRAFLRRFRSILTGAPDSKEH
jgi:hypothetical protein